MTENYFSLLGVDKNFDIDLQQLKTNNLKLQQSLHPDRYVNHPASEKLAAVNKIAEINNAFDTLKSSYHRGEYLLCLMGVEQNNESHTIKDPQLLMEQMELREQLSEIREQHKFFEELQPFSEKVKNLVLQQQLQVADLFKQTDFIDKDKDELYVSISAALVKLRFLNKLQQEILRYEEHLDDY